MGFSNSFEKNARQLRTYLTNKIRDTMVCIGPLAEGEWCPVEYYSSGPEGYFVSEILVGKYKGRLAIENATYRITLEPSGGLLIEDKTTIPALEVSDDALRGKVLSDMLNQLKQEDRAFDAFADVVPVFRSTTVRSLGQEEKGGYSSEDEYGPS